MTLKSTSPPLTSPPNSKLIFMTLLEISSYLSFNSNVSQADLLLPDSPEYATLPIFLQSILRSKSINRETLESQR